MCALFTNFVTKLKYQLPTDNLPIIRQPAKEACTTGIVSVNSDSNTLQARNPRK